MALYEFDDGQAKFLQEMVSRVSFQGNIEQLDKSVAMGKSVLKALLSPIKPVGKPKLLKRAEEDIRGLTPEEQKVINESKCIS